MPRIECALCGAFSQQNEVGAVEPAGPPDLDTRPAEPLRSTVADWMQLCPYCGYASPDISYAAEGAAALAASPECKALESRFLRHAWLLEQMGHYADAGWTALHGAWLADDLGQAETAAASRRRALELWQRGKQSGQAFLDDLAHEFAVVCDLLRRLSQFDEARATCLAGLQEEPLPAVLEDILRLQLSLIQRRDTAAHNLEELPQRPSGATPVTLQ